ncbi:MAG: S8 family serine peptidase, partial [Acidobacteriota bacterium]|nr:S8 family serine peptidase [Acidobacteriota bacterium]
MRKPNLHGDAASGGEPRSDTRDCGPQPNATGRYVIVFRDGATDKGIELLESLNLVLAGSRDADAGVLREDEAGDADVIVYSRLGVAVLAAAPEQISRLADVALDSSGPILAVVPEKVRHVIGSAEPDAETDLDNPSRLKPSAGYTRADCGVTASPSFSEKIRPGADLRMRFAAFDESQATWGLQITNVVNSRFGGRGIRIAILDTGIELSVDAAGQVHYHPDFEGRTITAETFVPGTTSARDGDGHGTHCLGTACGPLRPPILPRYGTAYGAEIFVAKVADDIGRAPDGWIIAGINWAVCNGCQIISMSLGSRKEVGEPYSVVYENIALRALDAGVLIIAAAGNCFDDQPCPVKEPADCPSIMAVGAITEDYKVASFSCAGINANGGEVDIVAPGVHVYSSYRLPLGHTRLSGTSAAAPHVAGIAALYAEANPGAVGKALWDLLIKPG